MTWAWGGSSEGSREAGTESGSHQDWVCQPLGGHRDGWGEEDQRERVAAQPLLTITNPNLVWTAALLTFPNPVQEGSPGISRSKHPFEVFGLLPSLSFFQIRKPASLSLYTHPFFCPNLSSPVEKDGLRVLANEFVLKCERLIESPVRQTEPRHKSGEKEGKRGRTELAPDWLGNRGVFLPTLGSFSSGARKSFFPDVPKNLKGLTQLAKARLVNEEYILKKKKSKKKIARLNPK